MGYQKVKGTQDFIGLDAAKMRYIEDKFSCAIKAFGFEEIKTPIIENSEVFIKNVGETSDVVTKEMYTFVDKGGRNITLRPEGTAAVARSYLENKMYGEPGLKKFFYVGPMFRYERQQVGRYRQFHQFGVEVYGSAGPMLDTEVILAGLALYESVGLKDKIVLKINSIGDSVSRANYSKALKEYFAPVIDTFCEDCRNRINTNPLRILDCKVDANREEIKNAPKISEYLTDESKEYFAKVQKYLSDLGVKYVVDETLVRGLDYYTDIVFEFIIESDDELNGLAAGAGGKYANMLYDMGKVNVPGIGFAIGLERVKLLIEKLNLIGEENFAKQTDLFIMGLDEDSKIAGLKLAESLRSEFVVVCDVESTSMKSQFKNADRVNPKYIIIIGEDERNTNTVIIKDCATREQVKVAASLETIKEYVK